MSGLKIVQILSLWLIVFLTIIDKRVSAVSCFTCSSKNGSDVNCEDPFHPAHSTYSQDCMVPREDHIGKFPANFCVKISGISSSTGDVLMIRTCVFENMDSQCGSFVFSGEKLSGCILTCFDDGCNEASPRASTAAVWLLPMLFVAALLAR
ncbi:unnamed protein product [Meganyctiphanes norvegica]|uniref:Protein sleepless n=1 Tax=Meganyctiphanes norvegica TaxID=48144 RepID=A0AAV2RBS6_MEGNR